MYLETTRQGNGEEQREKQVIYRGRKKISVEGKNVRENDRKHVNARDMQESDEGS
jgi:predicted chitinase